jgi:CubicO group peptidase (beta-lactamase class C family)
MKALALSLSLFLTSGLDASAATDAYAPMKKELSTTIYKEMSLNKVKGLTIAVVDDQRVVWTQGFGYADEAARTPAGPDTVYRVGSISKVVTSMRVMQLADAGLLDIDEDVRRYVPEFSIRSRFTGSPSIITPRMLMSHHSGLPSDVVAGMWSEKPMSLAQYIPTLQRESLANPPATQWQYSNVAFSLLGRMVEKVEGKDFNKAMRQGLLGPLGMASSSYVMTEALAPRYAQGYKDGTVAPRPTLRDQPAGSLFSTASDLCSLMSAVFAGGRGLLSGKALAEMATAQFPGLPLDFGHENGLGWMLSGLTLADGRHLMWHGGTVIPFQAFMAVQPEEKIGVVILANSEEASRFISTLAIRAVELAIQARPQTAEPILRSETGPAQKLSREPATPDETGAGKPKPVTLGAEALARITGDYSTFGGMLGKVWLDHGALKMWLWDREVAFEPVGNDRFLPRKEALFGLVTRVMPSLSFEFEKVQGREVLVLRGNPMPIPFEKMPVRPIPKAWKNRYGKYLTDQPGEGICYKGIELAEQDGLLVARIAVSAGAAATKDAPLSQAVFPLVPVSDDEAVIGGIGIGTGAVVRAVNGGLYHSGYDFKRVE